MLYLIEIHWTRRVADPELPPGGVTVMAEFGPSLTAATTKAVRKFQRHYHIHRAITSTNEKQDPARHDCGSGQHLGTCTACGRPHGYRVFPGISPLLSDH